MRTATVSRRLVEANDGLSLKAGRYSSEDSEALVALASPRVKKEVLSSLCRIFKGDIFKAVFVDSATHGAPYASANELVRIDVPRRRFIAHSQREKWADLLLQPKTTLVTCSGMNLGEAILVHDDMGDLVGSPI